MLEEGKRDIHRKIGALIGDLEKIGGESRRCWNFCGQKRVLSHGDSRIAIRVADS